MNERSSVNIKNAQEIVIMPTHTAYRTAVEHILYEMVRAAHFYGIELWKRFIRGWNGCWLGAGGFFVIGWRCWSCCGETI